MFMLLERLGMIYHVLYQRIGSVSSPIRAGRSSKDIPDRYWSYQTCLRRLHRDTCSKNPR